MRRRSELEHMMGAACANPNKASQFTSRATARRRTSEGMPGECRTVRLAECGGGGGDVMEILWHSSAPFSSAYLHLSTDLVVNTSNL